MKSASIKQKRIGVLALFLIVAGVVGGFLLLRPAQSSTVPSNSTKKSSAPIGKLIPKNQIQADAQQLISTVESAHPAFSMNTIPPKYEKAKQTFLSKASADMTLNDFSWLIRAYLSSLEDEHTHIEGSGLGNGERLDLLWQSNGDKLYLLDEEGKQTDRQVMEIGGIPVKELFAAIKQYYPMENETGVQFYNSHILFYKSVLNQIGVPCTADSLPVAIKSDGKVTVREVGFTKKPEPYITQYSDTTVSAKKMGDVYYIDFRQCQINAGLNDVVAQLKHELAKGTSKIIIDVRNNPGGSDKASKMLLEAMDMKVPEYGGYARFSSLAQKLCSYPKKSGFGSSSPDIKAAKRNPKVLLAVLTNETTCSSAMSLVIWVQDGKLGKIIGKPSINSPSCYGDSLDFKLTNTGIQCFVSHKFFSRPDEKADPVILHPDILVPDGDDSLQTALKYLK